MATPVPDKKYLIDGTLGQDPLPAVTAAELDAHRLMSRWRGENPNCLTDPVKKDGVSVIKLADRIIRSARDIYEDVAVSTIVKCSECGGSRTVGFKRKVCTCDKAKD